MRMRLLAAGGTVGLVLGGGLLVGLNPASAGDGGAKSRWPVTPEAAAAAAAESEAGTQTIEFQARTVRDAGVDVGKRGESPGDYFVFEDNLYDRSGTLIGRDSGRCMLILRTFRCEATFLFPGKGKIEVSSALFTPGDARVAITGGTGIYRDARGVLIVTAETGSTIDFRLVLV